MSNWMTDQDNLNKLNVSGHEVPETLFQWLKDVALEAKKNGKDYRSKLAGQLSEEYEIKDRSGEFESWLATCSTTGNVYQSWKEMVVLNENAPIMLSNLWVNYQKKHEFNPMHNHGGLFSFVIFINVPYDLEEEDKFFPEKKDPKTSRLCFVMNSPMGVPEEVAIPVDKGFEGKMILFDAKLPHMVYPFYTSDGERITASGNVVYEREPF